MNLDRILEEIDVAHRMGIEVFVISQRHDVAARHLEIVERLRGRALELKAEMLAEGGRWYPDEPGR